MKNVVNERENVFVYRMRIRHPLNKILLIVKVIIIL